MFKTLFTQIQYELNGLMNAVKMGVTNGQTQNLRRYRKV